MKIRKYSYRIGVIVAFLGVSGIAEAITGQGSGMASAAWFAAGVVLCLFGYVK
jgi:hypothetical protein